MKLAARRRGLLENLKKLKRSKRVTFFTKKPSRGKGSGKQQENLMDIVKIKVSVLWYRIAVRRVRGKNLTVNVPKKYNGKHGSRGYGGESSKHTQKIFLRDRFFNHSFSVLLIYFGVELHHSAVAGSQLSLALLKLAFMYALAEI